MLRFSLRQRNRGDATDVTRLGWRSETVPARRGVRRATVASMKKRGDHDDTLMALQLACDAAREAARLVPTRENREAALAAWNALEAATPRRKGRGGSGCRAGQRQATERRALVAESMRRQWARR